MPLGQEGEDTIYGIKNQRHSRYERAADREENFYSLILLYENYLISIIFSNEVLFAEFLSLILVCILYTPPGNPVSV